MSLRALAFAQGWQTDSDFVPSHRNITADYSSLTVWSQNAHNFLRRPVDTVPIRNWSNFRAERGRACLGHKLCRKPQIRKRSAAGWMRARSGHGDQRRSPRTALAAVTAQKRRRTPFRSSPPPIHTTHPKRKPLASAFALVHTLSVRRQFAATKDRSFRISLV